MLFFDRKRKELRHLTSFLVNSYGLNGMGIKAVELFHSIPVDFADEISYICVLNACSHSGLVDQARSKIGRAHV